MDESPFIEREENHQIYREMVGDLIYDVYEDLICAKFVRNQTCAKLGFSTEVMKNPICANFGFCTEFKEDPIYADFMKDLICAKFGYDSFRANFGSDPVRAKIGQNLEIKIDLRRSNMLRALLKIRGRIFLGRRELMQRRYKIRGRIFSWPARPDAARYLENI